MAVTVFGYLILISIDFYDYFSVFSLVLISIEKIFRGIEWSIRDFARPRDRETLV